MKASSLIVVVLERRPLESEPVSHGAIDALALGRRASRAPGARYDDAPPDDQDERRVPSPRMYVRSNPS